MKVILSHPMGNANVRAAAEGLLEANLLFEFFTSVASFPGTLLDRLGGFTPFSEIRRRRFNSNLESLTRVYPLREIGRILSMKAGMSGLVRHETGYFSLDSVYMNLDMKVAARLKKITEKEVGAVYNYEDGGLNSFAEGKQLGFKCFYDLPIGYWRAALKLLGPEKHRWAEWAGTLTNFEDSDLKLKRKDEELRLADVILVASTFTAYTLNEYPGILPPVEIVPYGFPPVFPNRHYESFSSNRPLKLLFVGGLTQRKGIADLFSAVAALKQNVELTIVGHKAGEDCIALNAALTHHKWIPSLSHADILALMRESDVLILPSLFEGFGLVITEAMSQGTPVITTNRTAGPDLISHNQNGWLIDAGSTEAIQGILEEILSNPKIIQDVGKEATETAKKRTWKIYGQEIANVVHKHLSKSEPKFDFI